MTALTTWSADQQRLISSTIAPGCSTDELALFAYACQRTGLDPFSKQIYAIKRGGRMTIQAGIDGLRSIAERTGELAGCQRYWCGPDGEWREIWLDSKPPAGAKAVIWRKGCEHPFVAVASLAEYDAGQGLWKKMPATMLAKCAEAQALRTGFPADLSGIYSTEEMQQSDVVEVTTTAPTPAPAPAQLSSTFGAGQRAITAAASVEKLKLIGDRLQQRHAAGELTDPERDQLLAMLIHREEELTPATTAAASDPDPFGDE